MPGKPKIFAMVDIGQTMFAFTVFLTTLKAAGGRKNVAEGAARWHGAHPVFVAIVLGVALGALGVGQRG
jgi:hypothetical protein